jgi:hypothetical protein
VIHSLQNDGVVVVDHAAMAETTFDHFQAWLQTTSTRWILTFLVPWGLARPGRRVHRGESGRNTWRQNAGSWVDRPNSLILCIAGCLTMFFSTSLLFFNSKIFKFEFVQKRKCSNSEMFKFKIVQIRKCSNLKLFRFEILLKFEICSYSNFCANSKFV